LFDRSVPSQGNFSFGSELPLLAVSKRKQRRKENKNETLAQAGLAPAHPIHHSSREVKLCAGRAYL